MGMNLEELYFINAMNDRNNVRLRAQNIHDNLGATPADIETFRGQHGGYGFLKALGIGAAATVLGAALCLTPIGSIGLTLGLIVGAIAGGVSMVMQNQKVMNGYNAYLDDFSAKVRESSGRSQGQSVEYDNSIAPGKSFSADLAASRDQPGLAAAPGR